MENSNSNAGSCVNSDINIKNIPLAKNLDADVSSTQDASLLPFVSVVGGVNIDIQGYSYGSPNYHDSNPGCIQRSFGGVARNIAENLLRLGARTKFMGIVGDDAAGRQFFDHSAHIGLDVQHCLVLADKPSSCYLSVMSEKNELLIAIASMDIMDLFVPELLAEKQDFFCDSQLCVLDTNLLTPTIAHIVKNYPQKIFVDTVSVHKAKKIKSLIGRFHTIKTNRLELAAITDMPTTQDTEIEAAAHTLISQGLPQLIVTLGEDGLYYNNGKERGFLRPNPSGLAPVSVTGAGDACMAGIVYAYLKGWDIRAQAHFGLCVATFTLMHKDAIHPELSLEKIYALQRAHTQI